MADDPNKKGYQDRSKVSTSEEHELRYWSEKWGVTREQIIDAVQATGSNGVNTIEDYLKRKGFIKSA